MKDTIFTDIKNENKANPNMVKAFDLLIDAEEILKKSHISSDPETTKELAMIKLISSEKRTKEILRAIEGSPEGGEIEKLFPKDDVEAGNEPPVTTNKVSRYTDKRLLLIELDSEAEKNKKSYVAVVFDKKADTPYELIGAQELTGLDEEAIEECHQIVKNSKADLTFLTDELVKKTY